MNPSVLRCSQEFLFVLSSPPRLSRSHGLRPSSSPPLPMDKPSLSRALPPSPRRALAVGGGGGWAAGGFDSGHVGSLRAAGGAGMQLASVHGVDPEAGRSLGLRC